MHNTLQRQLESHGLRASIRLNETGQELNLWFDNERKVENCKKRCYVTIGSVVFEAFLELSKVEPEAYIDDITITFKRIGADKPVTVVANPEPNPPPPEKERVILPRNPLFPNVEAMVAQQKLQQVAVLDPNTQALPSGETPVPVPVPVPVQVQAVVRQDPQQGKTATKPNPGKK